jgi:carboxypeptidase family protein/Kelch motif protein
MLFVASLILAVTVVGSIAAAAPGQTQAIDPGAWTWGPSPHPGPQTSSATTSAAQSGPAGRTLTGPTGNQVVVGQSSKNDTSASLRTMATPFTPSTQKQQVFPVLPLPGSTTTERNAGPTVGHVQTKLAAPKMPGTLLNFEGIDFPGVNCDCAPPDTNGAVGATQYVQIVNTGLEVFDKSTGNPLMGGPVSIESIWSGFGGVCQNNGEGDPDVLYDKLASRWVVSQFAGTAQPTHECVAVSTSSDATGTWNRYDFDLGSTFGNNFYDYPKVSTWPDAYYMSTNVFNAAGTAFLGPQPFALDRTSMLNGTPATIISTGILSPSDDQLMPADFDGSVLPPAGAPNPYTEIGTNPTWKLWRFHADFTNPSNSTFTLGGTLTPDPFNVICGGTGGACVPQAGVSDVLDTLGDRSMFRNDYRRLPNGQEALVGNMTVDSNGVAGIRWWQIDNATSGSPGFVQQSTYQPDNTYRWMGSAAMDASGDIAVGFSASSSSIHPEIRYAGRLAGDPPNTLNQGEATLFSGTGSQTDTNSRWGDYSDLTVDPSDDCTFWYTNEYYTTNSSFNWHTRIGNFKFPSCTSGPSGTLAGTVTDASNGNPLAGATVDASQGGQSFGSTTTDSNGDYSLALPVGTYDVTYSDFGYATDTESGVQITDGTTTTKNVALQPSPSVTLSGNVTDGSGHGWPLYARIDVAGDPASPFFTDPITGHYSIQLPANATYDVTFTSKVQGYQPDEQSIVVGGSDTTQNVQLSVSPDCSAPGYQQNTALQENFDGGGFPPPNWNVTDPLGNGQVWQLNDPEGQPNNTGGTGNFADINSDFYGFGSSQDTSLVSPTLDLSNSPAPKLTFRNDYFGFPGQVGDVDVSTDGGTTWTNVWQHTSDSVRGPDLETVNLPQAANQANVKLRFHFTASFGFWWEVDDVSVTKGSCAVIPGGLVEGNVSDLTTGNAINGAKVVSNDAPSDNATTAAVPDDPNNPGGFYILFSTLTGSHSFTASASQHSSDTETANVAANGTVRRDFKLGSGHLVITPSSVSSTQVLGSTTTQTLNFKNDGTGSANVQLNEQGGGFQILHAQGAPLTNIRLPSGEDGGGGADPGWLGDHTNDGAPPVDAGAPKDPTWATIANYPTAVMDNGCDFINGKEYCVGGINGSLSITNQGFVYDQGTNAWTPIANMANAREKPGVAAVNGKLYVSGGWDTNGTPIAATEVYDPASNSWSTVAPNPSPAAAPGVAVANGKIYFVGGCADGACTASNKVEVYDPSSNTWSSAANYPTGDSWEGCGGVNGKVYCAGGINGSTTYNTGNVYDPSSDSWSPIANLPTDLWGGVSGAPTGELVISGGVINQSTTVTNEGFAYTPSSDSWSAIPNAQFPRYRAGGGCGYYKIGGSSGGFSPTADSEVLGPGLDQCGTTDVPWLSESPTKFTVPAGATVSVTVALTATTADGVTQPGTYTAQILVNADTPQTISPIGVTMNVTPPKSWGKLQGTVTGTDCNNVTKGLSAVVFADGSGSGFSWTAKTDKNGNYAFWGPKDTYDLIATANGWIAQTKSAKIQQGKTTTVNFNLRPTGC